MTQKQSIEPWTINSCPGQHYICPQIWKNKFTDHEIHCRCKTVIRIAILNFVCLLSQPILKKGVVIQYEKNGKS